MATSEPLVPTGLPYGEREQVRAQMQQAGVPLAPVEGDPPFAGNLVAAPPSQASSTTADEVARFDALANRAPTMPMGSNVQQMSVIQQYRETAAASGNAVANAVAQLIDEYRPGV